MKVLSVKQPYAWLICAGLKDIENRTWKLPEKMKGERVLIHSSTSKPEIETNSLLAEILRQKGWLEEMVSNYHKGLFIPSAIIGSVILEDCVQNHTSIWAIKDNYNWVLKDPILFEEPILNIKGKLNFWNYETD